MLDPDEERVYQEIHRLYRQGNPVRVREPPSGFPTVTVDGEDLHVVTCIIRLGQSVVGPTKNTVRLFGKRLERPGGGPLVAHRNRPSIPL